MEEFKEYNEGIAQRKELEKMASKVDGKRIDMILNKQQRKELEIVARPLMKWLSENCHPHVKIIMDDCRCEVVEGVCMVPYDPPSCIPGISQKELSLIKEEEDSNFPSEDYIID